VTITYDADKLELAAAPMATDGANFVIVDYKTEPAGTLRVLGVHFGEGQSNPNTDLMKLSLRAKENAPEGPTNVEVTRLVTADETGAETDRLGTVHVVHIEVIDKSVLNTLIVNAQSAH